MLPVSLINRRTFAYLIAAALFLGAGTIEFYRRHASTRERARFGLLRDDAELFVGALTTSLRVPEACAGIFGPLKITPGARAPVELGYRFAPESPTPLGAGVEAWPGTQLGTLDLTVPKDADQRTRYRGQNLRRYRARVDASFVIRDRFATGVDHQLEVLLWVDDDDVVRGCFGPSSVGALCNMTGGYYDAAADPAARCAPSLYATIETKDGPLRRGTCRVTRVVRRATECPGGTKGALVVQDKVGFRTAGAVVCRSCE